jgi:hypothetical protein
MPLNVDILKLLFYEKIDEESIAVLGAPSELKSMQN